MDAIRDLLKKNLVAIIAFVVGLFIGLVVLGWWLWPVQWTDAAPLHLQKDYRADYLLMAVNEYALTKSVPLAEMRWKGLGDQGQTALDDLKKKTPGDANIAAFEKDIISIKGTEPKKEEGGFPILLVLAVMCVLTLLLAAALIAFYLLRGGKSPTGTITPAMEAQEAARQAIMTDYTTEGGEPPMAQFMASYKLGDDLFDDSFSIDSPTGEFLGECGVGISETIGVGDPKKVTAFEVWLFDKNDIQTVTKVLMSAHAFGDENIRQRLAAKGEPVLAQTGEQVVLETQTLQLVARVVEMSYGEGALPSESFFDQVILELAIWQKP
jgi:hypothetical protein